MHVAEGTRNKPWLISFRYGRWWFLNGRLYHQEKKSTANGRYSIVDWFTVF